MNDGTPIVSSIQDGLKSILGTPVDILFEIFSDLKPKDLLNLSRTTKELRSILLHPSAECVWSSACKNIKDFPPKPVDLSYPHYASIMFDEHCEKCTNSTSGLYFVYAIQGGRVCRTCSGDVYTPDLISLVSQDVFLTGTTCENEAKVREAFLEVSSCLYESDTGSNLTRTHTFKKGMSDKELINCYFPGWLPESIRLLKEYILLGASGASQVEKKMWTERHEASATRRKEEDSKCSQWYWHQARLKYLADKELEISRNLQQPQDETSTTLTSNPSTSSATASASSASPGYMTRAKRKREQTLDQPLRRSQRQRRKPESQ